MNLAACVALTLAARSGVDACVVDRHRLHCIGRVAVVSVSSVVLRRADAISTVPIDQIRRIETADGSLLYRADASDDENGREPMGGAHHG